LIWLQEDVAAEAADILRVLPGRAALRHLYQLRNVSIATTLAVIVVAVGVYHVALPVLQLMVGVSAFAIFNIYTWCRLREQRSVSELEFFRHLVLDVQVMTYLLSLTGDDNNPFAYLFLVPLTITAAYLDWRYTMAMLAITFGDYVFLHVYYLPLQMPNGSPVPDGVIDAAVNVSYLMAASVIALFVTRIASTARGYASALAKAREKQLNDQFVVGFGTLAAGAAHEMATPLSVIAVLVKELRDGRGDVREGLETIGRQVQACKRTLEYLSEAAGRSRLDGNPEVGLDRFLESVACRFQMIRPDARLGTDWGMPSPAPVIRGDLTLAQSLLTLLNNAADASKEAVEMKGSLRNDTLVVEVEDRGAGIPKEIADHLGRAFVTTKGPERGMGMGLFLAKTAIERLGGTLEFFSRQGGGTRVSVTLPLATLQA
jgi:two-component system, sensor histidine kinase RegB